MLHRLVALFLIIGFGSPALSQDLDQLLATMSVEQKIAQMHIVGLEGHRVSRDAAGLIAQEGIGGFYLRPMENFVFPTDLRKLAEALQRSATESPGTVPLFIAVNHEGGALAAIHPMLGATDTPGNLALGASGRPEDTRAAYSAIGADLRAAGVNMNLVHALDVLQNPANPQFALRVFGGATDTVATLGAEAVRALDAARVVPCAGSFPGLIPFAEDLRISEARVDASDAELWENDLAATRAAIAADAPMIMMSPAHYRAWDKKHLATFSGKVIQGILRERLAYTGLIVSADLSSAAASKPYKPGPGAVLAIEAGCDLLFQSSPSIEDLRERISDVAAAVRSERIPLAQIDASVRAILTLKKTYGLFDASAMGAVAQVDPAAVAAAAANGIVVQKNEGDLLPLNLRERRIVCINPSSTPAVPQETRDLLLGPTLGYVLRERENRVVECRFDTIPTAAQRRHALDKAREAEVVVVGLLFARQTPEQQAFVNELIALEKPVVLVALGHPADLDLFEGAAAAVAAHNASAISLRAAADVLAAAVPSPRTAQQ